MRVRGTKRLLLILSLAFLAAPVPIPAQDGVRVAIVNEALRYRGTPYVYGAMSPKGFDCSGYTSWVFKNAAGISLPRTARGQAAAGVAVSLAEARPGDLLIFDTVGGRPSHVGILLENRKFSHAASAGPKTGIIVSSLNEKYYAQRIIGARRVLASPPPLAEAPPPAPAKPAGPVSSGSKPAAAKPKEAPAPKVADTPTPAKPDTPQSGSPLSAQTSPSPMSEPIVLGIGPRMQTFSDPIPALKGSSLQFTLRNDSGKSGTFEVLFYKLDRDPSKHRTLRRDRIRIGNAALQDLAPLAFPEEGRYRLIIKTHDNFKRVERTWTVRGL